MVTVRWGRSAFEGTVPVKARWGRSAFEGTEDSTPKVRWGRSAVEGTVVATTVVRWGRAAVDGTRAVVIEPFTNLSAVEPETVISLTALLEGGDTADSYTWRRVSGPTVSLNAASHMCTFRAPSAMPPGATLVVGVTATLGGVTSLEQTVTVTVVPQTRWFYDPSINPPWRGKQPLVWIEA